MATREPEAFPDLQSTTAVANDVEAPQTERLPRVVQSIADSFLTNERCYTAAAKFNEGLKENPHPTITGVAFDPKRRMFTFFRIPSENFPEAQFERTPERFFALGAATSREIIQKMRDRLRGIAERIFYSTEI